MFRRMTTLALISVAAMALACPTAAKTRKEPPQIVYFGTHGGGPGQGIWAARFDPATGQLQPLGLAAEIDRPTWQVADPDKPVLYSVSETGNDGKTEAGVYSLAIDRVTGKLTLINRVGSGGGGATHLALDPHSHTLFVANFGTGTVAAVPIGADGTLAPVASRQQDVGTGPSPRQKSPHAHAVAIAPGGHFLLAADLGADRIFVYHFDPVTRMLTPATKPFEVAPPGSGPRHIAFAPSGRVVYIDSELTGQVTAYGWDATEGHMHAIQTVSAFPADYAGELSAAELALSRDGRFLYVSTRNNDSLVVYAVSPDSGLLNQVQQVGAGGKTPWSFSLSPDGHWLLVANEASSLITEFRVDPRSGKLATTDRTLAIPKPVSVVFAPR